MPTESRMVPGTDAGRPQLVVAQLTMRRAGRMDDQALRIADVREVRPQRHAADEVLPAARPPRQSNENTAPAPRGRYLSTSGR